MNWPPYRDLEADVSSVSPSSERMDSKRSKSQLSYLFTVANSHYQLS